MTTFTNTRGELRYGLPHSLVKGRLRQSWEELASIRSAGFPSWLMEWLGAEPDKPDEHGRKPGSVEPHRARIHFSDFLSERAPDAAATTGRRYRIRIDRDLGSVERGALLTVQAPWGSGEDAVFEGHVTVLSTPGADLESVRIWLDRGFRWMTSLGGERTVGFGAVRSVGMAEPEEPNTTNSRTQLTEPRLTLKIRPRAPFCLAWHKAGDNLFESRAEIPGAAIKGCIAETWGLQTGKTVPELAKSGNPVARHFDSLVFSHAFPTNPGVPRPSAVPISLVQVRGGEAAEFHDVSRLCRPHLIEGQTPSFPIDWKGGLPNSGPLATWFGRPHLGRQLDVHVAMNRHRRKGDDSRLFALESVIPWHTVWMGSIDLVRVPKQDQEAVVSALEKLLPHGLHGLGKTKVHADVTIENDDLPDTPTPTSHGLWVVTLQTPAILAEPSLAQTDGLLAAYRRVWTDLSAEELDLTHLFALQEYAGGYYLHHRFQPSRSYEPWVLTSAGSVFVFKGTPGAAGILGGWLRTGLPVPEWMSERGKDWHNCPFVPENGYGEIKVNHPVHDDFAARMVSPV